jgi:hypothetical protein
VFKSLEDAKMMSSMLRINDLAVRFLLTLLAGRVVSMTHHHSCIEYNKFDESFFTHFTQPFESFLVPLLSIFKSFTYNSSLPLCQFTVVQPGVQPTITFSIVELFEVVARKAQHTADKPQT